MASLLNIIIIGYQEKVVKVQSETQEQQLQEIGAYLKQVREEKSIRIEEIAAKTRIRLFCLKALEEGKLEDLPEPIYVKGFIRRYGDELELDGSALSQKFADTFPQEQPKVDIEETPVGRKVNIPILPILYIFLIGTAVFGLVSILNPQRQISSSNQSETSPTPSKKKVASELPVSKVASTPKPKPSPTKKADKSTVQVKLKTKERSWLEVRVDGVQKFQDILEKDKQQNWTGKQQIYVRSGNAGGVLISIDGSQFKPFGEIGQIEQATYKVESTQVEPTPTP
ncbi:MAG: helix-turn-helix domain-containing protein [Mastigocoleus sp.]